jgi:hypothetical protein
MVIIGALAFGMTSFCLSASIISTTRRKRWRSLAPSERSQHWRKRRSVKMIPAGSFFEWAVKAGGGLRRAVRV